MKGARFWTFVVILSGLVLVYAVATQQAVPASEASALAGTVPSGNAVTAGSIWSHNLLVALLELIPIAGFGIAGYSAWITGLTTASLAEAGSVPSINLVGYLILTPFFWLEFSAYALSLTASFWLMKSAANKSLRTELPYFGLAAVGVAVILALSALVELTYVR